MQPTTSFSSPAVSFPTNRTSAATASASSPSVAPYSPFLYSGKAFKLLSECYVTSRDSMLYGAACLFVGLCICHFVMLITASAFCIYATRVFLRCIDKISCNSGDLQCTLRSGGTWCLLVVVFVISPVVPPS